MTFTLIVIFA